MAMNPNPSDSPEVRRQVEDILRLISPEKLYAFAVILREIYLMHETTHIDEKIAAETLDIPTLVEMPDDSVMLVDSDDGHPLAVVVPWERYRWTHSAPLPRTAKIKRNREWSKSIPSRTRAILLCEGRPMRPREIAEKMLADGSDGIKGGLDAGALATRVAIALSKNPRLFRRISFGLWDVQKDGVS